MTRSRRKNAGIVALFQIFPTQSWAFWRSELLPNFARSPLASTAATATATATGKSATAGTRSAPGRGGGGADLRAEALAQLRTQATQATVGHAAVVPVQVIAG